MKDLSSNNPKTIVAKYLQTEVPSCPVKSLRIQSQNTPTYCGGSITIPSFCMTLEEFSNLRKEGGSKYTTGLGQTGQTGGIVLDYDNFMVGLYGRPHMYFQIHEKYTEMFREFMSPCEEHNPIILEVKNNDFTLFCIDSSVFYSLQHWVKHKKPRGMQ